MKVDGESRTIRFDLIWWDICRRWRFYTTRYEIQIDEGDKESVNTTNTAVERNTEKAIQVQ
jgi:hypothetical protein